MSSEAKKELKLDCKDAHTKDKFIQQEPGNEEGDGKAENEQDEMAGFWSAIRPEKRLHGCSTKVNFLYHMKFQKFQAEQSYHTWADGRMFGMICRGLGGCKDQSLEGGGNRKGERRWVTRFD